jgi:mycoredoxin
MKKLLIIIFIFYTYQEWGFIYRTLNPPPDYGDLHDGKVILYSTVWCTYCAKTRAFLEKNDIAYYDYDIEQSKEGKRQYDSLGGRGVPVLLINGQVVRGFRPLQIMDYFTPPTIASKAATS